jgi:hypothetical protein
MSRRRFRWDMRMAPLAAAAFAIGIALLVLWLGHRHDRLIDRLVAEGELAQGRFLSQTQGDRDSAGTLDVAYTVNGVGYRTSTSIPYSHSEPLFPAEAIRIPRLGPERAYQVVYLPSDPSTARLRADMTKSAAAVYGTAGMFALAGLVFGGVGLLMLRRPRGLGG